jgi:DNA-directed RNA polymerase subunit RPC12/RpoP
MAVNCLRCQKELNEYVHTRVQKLRTVGGLVESPYALVECPECGHTEVLSLRSKHLVGMKRLTRTSED